MEISDSTFDILEKYAETFPGEGIGTLSLREDISETELAAYVSKAIKSGKPIDDRDETIYTDWWNEDGTVN